MKSNPCKKCGSKWHTAFKCPLNKRKPMRKEAVKTREKRLATRELWFELNPPDSNGFWYCYLQIHPWCPKRLTEATVVLEHTESKTRHPESKYNVKKLKPACDFCNEMKGSRDLEDL